MSRGAVSIVVLVGASDGFHNVQSQKKSGKARAEGGKENSAGSSLVCGDFGLAYHHCVFFGCFFFPQRKAWRQGEMWGWNFPTLSVSASRCASHGTPMQLKDLQQPPQCHDLPEACGRSWSSSPGLTIGTGARCIQRRHQGNRATLKWMVCRLVDNMVSSFSLCKGSSFCHSSLDFRACMHCMPSKN